MQKTNQQMVTASTGVYVMTTKEYGLWGWYRKTPKERQEIVIKSEMDNLVQSLTSYYRGLGELHRKMEELRGEGYEPEKVTLPKQ